MLAMRVRSRRVQARGTIGSADGVRKVDAHGAPFERPMTNRALI